MKRGFPDSPFDEDTLDNDIAILKLEKPLEFNKNIQPACLPSDDFEPEVGSTCFVSGWGTKKEGKWYSKSLQPFS